MIKRNFTDRSQATLIPLYKSLVRPHLEYCCSVWNPHFRKDIELIEGVQRRATKLVKDVEHLHYNDRLEHLGLMCLHTRRIRSDLIDTYKIINGIYNVNTEFLIMIKVADEAIQRNYLKEDLGWISENLHLVIE